MHSQRTAAVLRALGKPVLTGVLGLLLLFSALASASDFLHECLHSDHQAPTHYCLVTALDHGQTEAPTTGLALAPIIAEVHTTTLPIQSFFISHDTKLFPERGPPALS
jgi:hypothetical protein